MAVDTVIKVSGIIPANVTTDGVAIIDVPEDGEILAISSVLMGLFDPQASLPNTILKLAAELSFLSTNQFLKNDSRGSIFNTGVSGMMSASSEAPEAGGGALKLSEHAVLSFDKGIIINAGERLHLHSISNAIDLTADITFTLYIKTKGGARRVRARR